MPESCFTTPAQMSMQAAQMYTGTSPAFFPLFGPPSPETSLPTSSSDLPQKSQKNGLVPFLFLVIGSP